MRSLTRSLTPTLLTPKILTLTLLTLSIPLWLLPGCAGGVTPAVLDTKNDQCGTCRMVVSAQATASQVVAPNQEPKFFDDLGCLDQFLAASPLAKDARVFVADHRTGDWVAAESAVFTRTAAGAGAMGSPFIAHASAASREADRGAVGRDVPVGTALPSVPSLRTPGGSR